MLARALQHLRNLPARARQCLAHWPTLAVVAGILLSLVLFYGPTDNWSWDPSFYYAQLRSPIIDGDLDLRGETVPPEIPYTTVTGLMPSQWPVGPGLLWAPFFLLAHLFKSISAGNAAATGLTPIYIGMVSAGAALYGLLGVFVIYRTCRLFAGKAVSSIAAGLTLFSTPLFFYIYRQPLMAHSTSLLAAALLIYAIVAVVQGKLPLWQSGVILGALVGLNTILRWVGGVTVLLVAMLYLSMFVTAVRQRDGKLLRAVLLQSTIAAGVAMLVFLPQMAFWYRLHRAWVVMPISGFAGGYAPLHLRDLFVHTNRGLLLWAPFIVIGLAGLVRLQPARLQLVFWPYLLTYVYILARWEIWHGGGGFGPRFFIELLPLVGIGFVLVARPLWRSWYGRGLLGVLSVGLIGHQLAMVAMVEQIWLPLADYFAGEPIDLQNHGQALARLVSDPGAFFQPRPHVGIDREALLVSYLTQQTDLQQYLLPLIALVTIPAGIIAFKYVARRRLLWPAALILVGYMLVWAGFLLVV